MNSDYTISTNTKTVICIVTLLIVYGCQLSFSIFDDLVQTKPIFTPIFWTLLELDRSAGLLLGCIIPITALVLRSFSAPIAKVIQIFSDQRYIVVVVVGIIWMAGSIYVYHNYPLSEDEYAAVFQAQVFSVGRLTTSYPTELLDRLIPQQFQNYFFFVSHHTGQVLSGYWPGYALVLSWFVILGIPWACNATLSALSVLVIASLARRVFPESRSAAGWAILLTLASPVISINAMAYYAMPLLLLLNAVFAWLLLTTTPRACFFAGICGGFALTAHNPVPHLLFAIPWLIWLSLRADRIRTMGSLIVGYLPASLVLGLGWVWLKSSVTGTDVATDETTYKLNAAGALVQVTHIVTEVFRLPNLAIYCARFAGLIKVILWATPALFVVVIYGANLWCRQRWLLLLGCSAIVTFLGYFFVPFDQGHGWGYRYFQPAWFALPLLAVPLLLQWEQSKEVSAQRAATAIAFMALLNLVFGTGWRAYQTYDFIGPHLAKLPITDTDQPTITFINTAVGAYTADLVQNDPFLVGKRTIFVSYGLQQDLAFLRANFPNATLISENAYGHTWRQ